MSIFFLSLDHQYRKTLKPETCDTSGLVFSFYTVGNRDRIEDLPVLEALQCIERSFLYDKMTFCKSQQQQQYHPNPLHTVSEQKVIPVIIRRTHLDMFQQFCFLQTIIWERFLQTVKINENLAMNLLLNIFNLIQHCLIVTEMLGNLNDLW